TKRIFDVVASIAILIVSPLLYFFVHTKTSFWPNIFLVLSGKYTWVSYHPGDPMTSALPHLYPGILSPIGLQDEILSSRRLEHIHYVYARDYHWSTDLSILITQIKKIGQKPMSYE
ncbi:MAG TPA: hypothetical protein VMZ69_06590, partial [Saprospiraceae bacterium]|nr:hypothetical protein [Saprospiraceae bacterium]